MKALNRFVILFGLTVTVSAGCEDGRSSDLEALRWWRGNLHTHSLWSDGDDYPEMVIDVYKRLGYHFIALSDHNVLAEGEKWVDVAESRGGTEAYEKYLSEFGSDWVERREKASALEVRLKTLEEYRSLFEETGNFLIIQAEEITDDFERKPVHVNATNLVEVIPPQGGGSVREVMQNNIDAVLAQRKRIGDPMFPHLNHPNFGWAVTAEDLIALQGDRFFEVYNGHPAVHNEGDELHPSTERMWDIILAGRLAHGDGVMFGIAVDDAHNYHVSGSDRSNPGRGWVMVRTRELTPEAIVEAMEAGDFYASTGVLLEDVRFENNRILLKIRTQEGIVYTTQFIGTREGYDTDTEAVKDANGEYVTRRYSADIGEVLDEVETLSPSYTLKGDEIYVRAKITSSELKENPYKEGELEVAWTQPYVPQR